MLLSEQRRRVKADLLLSFSFLQAAVILLKPKLHKEKKPRSRSDASIKELYLKKVRGLLKGKFCPVRDY